MGAADSNWRYATLSSANDRSGLIAAWRCATLLVMPKKNPEAIERDRRRTEAFLRRLEVFKADHPETRRHGWQADVARAAGIEVSTVSRIFQGRRFATPDQLFALATVLGTAELLPDDLRGSVVPGEMIARSVSVKPAPVVTRPRTENPPKIEEDQDDLNRVSVLARKLSRLSPRLKAYDDRHQVRDEVIAVLASSHYRPTDESDEALAEIIADAEQDLLEQYGAAARPGAQRGAEGRVAPRAK